MSLAGQWHALRSELPEGWQSAGLQLELRDHEAANRAAGLLGPAGPYRAAPATLRFTTALDGTAPGPDAVTRLLAGLDRARIGGDLALAGSTAAAGRHERVPIPLATAWDAALAGLPSDWSDLLCELALRSTDYIERVAILCVQLNPRRDGDRAAVRFRCARVAGYGVAPEMARRCFERCDRESIQGTVSVLRLLSDSRHVATQGPVWPMLGKTV